ncbi:MAG TPA: Kdo hydroxylase family protein [Vicinamibacterales bacterium]|nr:Kdo hydroxylase family protein [Vicinamibacterales bacterium]
MATVWRAAIAAWNGPVDPAIRTAAASALEAGAVIFLPDLRFQVLPAERNLFTPAILGAAKNASFDPASGRLGGTSATGLAAAGLRDMVARFSDRAAALVDSLFPQYRGRIARGRASFRPAEIAGRKSTWRKDDTRLHVDSFPATPSGGRRILRVFTNVNPDGRARAWRIGDDFEAVAHRFARQLRLPLPGSGRLLALLRVTKSRRTAYDALMLQLHDRMKYDDVFQRESPQTAIDFPAGSTWLAFTDQVSHAAMAGQYQLEQTFLLPVAAMHQPERSPLRILEKIKGRALA